MKDVRVKGYQQDGTPIRMHIVVEEAKSQPKRFQPAGGFPFDILIERPINWMTGTLIEWAADKVFDILFVPVLERLRKLYERFFKR